VDAEARRPLIVRRERRIVMAQKIETKRGRCDEHGDVQAQRTMPAPSFPFLVYAVRRALAARKPYRCPECGQPAVV
jgi:hypothetical protein